MLLTPQFEHFSPLNSQTLCTWECVNSTIRPLANSIKLKVHRFIYIYLEELNTKKCVISIFLNQLEVSKVLYLSVILLFLL